MIKQNNNQIVAADLWARCTDSENLDKINEAIASKRIDADAGAYMKSLYIDGMQNFREMFFFLGKLLGAPKTPIFPYNPENGGIEQPAEIALIGPQGTYLVNHRFDADPIRNQFFIFQNGSSTSLSISSIVTVIVAAQKNVSRAIDKVTGKYYDDYVNDVINVSTNVLAKHANDASVRAVTEKIKTAFAKKFVTNAAEEVALIIGHGYEKVIVDLVRELDKIVPPHARLRDVYRMKMLFDIIPQARAFIDSVMDHMKDQVVSVRDKFYDLDNKRNYRDAKIIVNIGRDGEFIPLEIICQVRMFFDFEMATHKGYEKLRGVKTSTVNANQDIVQTHYNGIRQYNQLIYDCIRALVERVGWNILYSRNYMSGESLLDGFPKIQVKFYPQKIVDSIMRKIDNNVRNEIFKIKNAARKLKVEEEIGIFRYMAKFILAAAIPYAGKYEKLSGIGMEYDIFNFVMGELYRYYENDVL